MQTQKNTTWINAFGVILVFISVYGLMAATILSVSLNVRSNYSILLICILPAILGIGIMKVSNIFRKITIGISLGLIIAAPWGYILAKRADAGNVCLVGLPRACQWIVLALFGLCSIIYLTRPGIKDQFISSNRKS